MALKDGIGGQRQRGSSADLLNYMDFWPQLGRTTCLQRISGVKRWAFCSASEAFFSEFDHVSLADQLNANYLLCNVFRQGASVMEEIMEDLDGFAEARMDRSPSAYTFSMLLRHNTLQALEMPEEDVQTLKKFPDSQRLGLGFVLLTFC